MERLSTELDLRLQIPRTLGALNQCIINTWDYETSKTIIREMFFESEKYLNGLECKNKIDFLVNDWYDKGFGDIEWPFSAMNFDGYIADVNRHEDLSEEEKDEMVAYNTVRFRRIKDINTCRNDYIESLIVYYNENIIPTFKHNRGLDFYINGEPFDQKVSRSVGKAFINAYGVEYYGIAIDNPHLVAISLYENQDKERFDADPRLYVVYLDDDITTEMIEQSIRVNSLENPMRIEFEYCLGRELRTYRTYCYVLLLHN